MMPPVNAGWMPKLSPVVYQRRLDGSTAMETRTKVKPVSIFAGNKLLLSMERDGGMFCVSAAQTNPQDLLELLTSPRRH